ncbi:hypothetical protein M6B38_220600 [Iris pallida]|uniref:Uncharacterized protein n=1 Tax=Iris pallida TaxID=29817 RepID=A0AAX6DYU1_IRIPA|nr:hypothetical protein M6B38_220600 [Iris pallida]
MMPYLYEDGILCYHGVLILILRAVSIPYHLVVLCTI